MIERTFQNIPDGKLGEADRQSFLIGLGLPVAATPSTERLIRVTARNASTSALKARPAGASPM